MPPREKTPPKTLDPDVTSSLILKARKEETLGSTLLSYRTICTKSLCVHTHFTLLRQSRPVIPFPIYRSRVSPLHRHRLSQHPTNNGSEIPRFFTGKEQTISTQR